MSDLIAQIINFPFDPLIIAVGVLALDIVIGDPAWLYRHVTHPVIPIGHLIAAIEARLNKAAYSNWARFWLGVMGALCVLAICTGIAIVLTWILMQLPAGGILYAVLASSLIAYNGLYRAVAKVMHGLQVSLQQGRAAIAHIVGRDPESLDEAGVARASIESLSENFLDGTVAPLFWFVLLGLPGLLFYKAVNTLDSMTGHHNDRFEYFGKFAARLDDVVNYIPARLTGVLICLAAVFVPSASASAALAAMMKDASGHKSVNAGWQEAAMAGALGVALAGPRQYGGHLTEDQWMNGAGRKEATAADIRKALRLYGVSGVLLLLILAALAGYRSF